MNGFHAANVALEIAAKLKPLYEIVKRKDADLADQMYRAVKSIVLAVPEGGRRSGKDRTYHFRIAAGSAAELAKAIQFAIEWKLCEPQDELLKLIDRELAMLWRLAPAK